MKPNHTCAAAGRASQTSTRNRNNPRATTIGPSQTSANADFRHHACTAAHSSGNTRARAADANRTNLPRAAAHSTGNASTGPHHRHRTHTAANSARHTGTDTDFRHNARIAAHGTGQTHTCGFDTNRARAHRPGNASARAADNRLFKADRPNKLWGEPLCAIGSRTMASDFTYVPTWSGTVYVAFVIDVFARRIVGWRASTSMKTQFVLDALDQAIWQRKTPDNKSLVHHSDRPSHGFQENRCRATGSQYLSIKYTERLAKAEIDL